MNKIQKNAAISIAVTGLFTGLAWAVHSTDGDPLLFWLALALTIIGLVQTGIALFGPEEAQEDI